MKQSDLYSITLFLVKNKYKISRLFFAWYDIVVVTKLYYAFFFSIVIDGLPKYAWCSYKKTEITMDWNTIWKRIFILARILMQKIGIFSRNWKKVVFHNFPFYSYRVSHSKVNKVILLWWGYRFQLLLIFWILCVHEIGTFMPNSSVFI